MLHKTPYQNPPKYTIPRQMATNKHAFTNPVAQGNLLDQPGQYLCITAEGKGAMLGWKDTLTTEQMWQVLTYIATLGQ